jgi:DNA-binding NtrC family response regulator
VDRKRTLIADDDPEMLDMVSRVVARFGLAAEIAASGDALLDKIADAGPFDLVITDVAMPWMTGLQVMQSARTAGMGGPVIVITAHRDQKTSHEVESLGLDVQLLYKPFSIDDLEAAIRRAIGEPVELREHA